MRVIHDFFISQIIMATIVASPPCLPLSSEAHFCFAAVQLAVELFQHKWTFKHANFGYHDFAENFHFLVTVQDWFLFLQMMLMDIFYLPVGYQHSNESNICPCLLVNSLLHNEITASSSNFSFYLISFRLLWFQTELLQRKKKMKQMTTHNCYYLPQWKIWYSDKYWLLKSLNWTKNLAGNWFLISLIHSQFLAVHK